jgi:CheY-like chemotaxis protein
MARLVASILTEDPTCKNDLAGVLRAASTPVSLGGDSQARDGSQPDLVIVDAREDIDRAMAAVERLRLGSASVAIFVIADEARPEVILQAMRAGANEFLTWPPVQSAFSEAIARTAARRQSTTGGRQATTLVFFGAKGGSGTTTLAVNCAVELARLSKRPRLRFVSHVIEAAQMPARQELTMESRELAADRPRRKGVNGFSGRARFGDHVDRIGCDDDAVGPGE